MANEIHPNKILNPNSYKLKKTYDENGNLNAYFIQIVDIELNPVDIIITWDDIEIDTYDFNYITLDFHNINYIYELMLDFKREQTLIQTDK